MNKSNESNDCYIWLRVRLSGDMHRKLKVLAANRGNTLQGLAVEILGTGVGCGPGGVVEVKEVPAKPKVVDGGGRAGVEPPKKYSAYTA